MNKNEIINADDYFVKFRNYTIQNGPFQGYGIKTKVVEGSLNCELFGKAKSGDAVKLNFTITPVRDLTQKDLVDVAVDAVVKEVSNSIKKITKEIRAGKMEMPKNLPYLDYFFMLPRELLLDSDFCEQVFDKVNSNLINYGMDKSDREKQLIKEAFSNFTQNDLIDLSNEAKIEKEKYNKFASDMNALNPFKK